MTPTCDELRDTLARFLSARDELLLGGAVVNVRHQDGRQVQFTPASRGDIEARIRELRLALNNDCGGCYSARRAIRVIPQG